MSHALPFVDDQGKGAVNFQIIGLVLLPIVLIVTVVFSVIGAINSEEGEHYRDPFSLRLIK